MNTTNKILMNAARPESLLRLEQAAALLARAVYKPVLAVARWNRVQRDSRALRNMSDHLLRDIGLTRDDVL